MSQPSDHPTTSPHNPWQFSLRGLLIFTVSVAIGAAMLGSYLQSRHGGASQGGINIQEGVVGGLLTSLIFWMLLGLLYQIRDLRVTLASNPGLTAEQCWGARLEIIWRLALIVLFGIYFLIALLANHGILVFKDKAVDLWIATDRSVYVPECFLNGMMRNTALYLLLFVLVGIVPCIYTKRQSSSLRRWLWLISMAVVAPLFLQHLMVDTLILRLVDIAILGIDYSFPPKLSSINAHIYNTRIVQFFWVSFFSTMIVIANWVILACMARQWSKGVKKLFLLLGLLIAGVTITSIYVVWFYCRVLPDISPYFVEFCLNIPLHFWVETLILLCIPITVLAYRMTVDSNPLPNIPRFDWRINPNKYYHQWRSLLLFLAILVLWFHWESSTWLRFVSSYAWLSNWRGVAEWCFYKPDNLLCLCLLFLTIHRALARREDPGHVQFNLPRVNPARFITVWFAALAVMISGIPTLVWSSFAFWFNPWWRGRWP